MDDINHVNNELLLYLERLNGDEINQRIQDVTCTIDQDINKIKEILSSKGIVIIPNFIPESSIVKLSEDLNQIREKLLKFVSSGKPFKDEANVLFQNGNFKLKIIIV